MCFNNETWSIARLCITIQNSADDITRTFLTDGAGSHSDRLVRWNSSNHPCHILNVDESCLGSPVRAGFGGLLQNNAGLFISGFSDFLPNTTCVLLAELTAILKGLRLAIDMGLDDWFAYQILSCP